MRPRQHRACTSLGRQLHLQRRLAGKLNLFVGVSRHRSTAYLATEGLKVSLLIGAAAAPRPSKAVKSIEQCIIAEVLVTSIAAGSSKLGNRVIGDSYVEKAASIFWEKQSFME